MPMIVRSGRCNACSEAWYLRRRFVSKEVYRHFFGKESKMTQTETRGRKKSNVQSKTLSIYLKSPFPSYCQVGIRLPLPLYDWVRTEGRGNIWVAQYFGSRYEDFLKAFPDWDSRHSMALSVPYKFSVWAREVLVERMAARMTEK